MSAPESRPPVVLCLASYFKGQDFLRSCHEREARAVLLTRENLRGEDWPWEALGEVLWAPERPTAEDYLSIVGRFVRETPIDRVVALEEYDVQTAALLREHLCLDGMKSTAARAFRDKLTMRFEAARGGVLAPAFAPAYDRRRVADFLARVPAPWVLKPRSDVSAMGIRKLETTDAVWGALDELDAREAVAERSPFFLLERYVRGDVFHVDSLVKDGRVVFAAANRYWRPPMEVAHQGGVFLTSGIKHDSREERQLIELNELLLARLGLENGAAHAEFIRGDDDGQFYFLEVAARVGGAFIAETVEAATGVNLWREWAAIELGGAVSTGLEPRLYSGLALSLARQEFPETGAYTDGEIAYRVNKRHHVGLIVRSPNLERIEELLSDYARRFREDFCAMLPPLERPDSR